MTGDTVVAALRRRERAMSKNAETASMSPEVTIAPPAGTSSGVGLRLALVGVNGALLRLPSWTVISSISGVTPSVSIRRR